MKIEDLVLKFNNSSKKGIIRVFDQNGDLLIKDFICDELFIDYLPVLD